MGLQVGGLLDNKGYGIAVSKTSPVSAPELSEIILKMQEDGRLGQLKTLWWKNKREGGKCVVRPGSNETRHTGARVVDAQRLV